MVTRNFLFLFFFVGALLTRKFIVMKLQRQAKGSKTRIFNTLAELTAEIRTGILGAFSLVLGVQLLNPSGGWGRLVGHLLFIIAAFQFGLLLHRVVAIWKRDHLIKRAAANSVMATLISASLPLPTPRPLSCRRDACAIRVMNIWCHILHKEITVGMILFP